MRLQRARELSGLSLQQAAAKLQLATGQLDAIEDGTPPSIETIRNMSDVYGVTIAWLQGAVPVVPQAIASLLRDASISDADREALTELIGAINTGDELARARGDVKAANERSAAQQRAASDLRSEAARKRRELAEQAIDVTALASLMDMILLAVEETTGAEPIQAAQAIRDLGKARDVAKRENGALVAENRRLSIANRTADAMHAENRRMAAELRTARDHIGTLEHDVAWRSTQADDLTASISAMESQRAELRGDVMALWQRLGDVLGLLDAKAFAFPDKQRLIANARAVHAIWKDEG